MKLKSNSFLKPKDYFFALLLFISIFTILTGLFGRMEYKAIQENKTRYLYVAINQSNMILNSVDAALSRAYTMKALILDNDGDIEFFDKLAKDIYNEANIESGINLKNIAVAPNGVVKKFYPMAGNENLRDFDFMDTSRAGNKEAVEAYKRGELVVTQPFKMVQGNIGMAGRLPVFLNSSTDPKFWGLVTVTMDFSKLISAFHLDSLSNTGLVYELWYSDENGERVSLTSSLQKPSSPVSYQFSIKNIVWNLDVEPVDGWIDYTGFTLAIIVIILISLMVSLLMLEKIKLNYANLRLEQLANLDSLTMCYSRHYVNVSLINQRTGCWLDPTSKYSLAMFDIDNFKVINDTYGHEVGDRAIVAIAQVLIDVAKESNGDCVVRYGGDEFIILLNDVTRERFEEKLNAVVKGVANIHFSDFPDIKLTVSGGGELYTSAVASDYYNMISQADRKLYLAKKNGRNQYCIDIPEE